MRSNQGVQRLISELRPCTKVLRVVDPCVGQSAVQAKDKWGKCSNICASSVREVLRRYNYSGHTYTSTIESYVSVQLDMPIRKIRNVHDDKKWCISCMGNYMHFRPYLHSVIRFFPSRHISTRAERQHCYLGSEYRTGTEYLPRTEDPVHDTWRMYIPSTYAVRPPFGPTERASIPKRGWLSSREAMRPRWRGRRGR